MNFQCSHFSSRALPLWVSASSPSPTSFLSVSISLALLSVPVGLFLSVSFFLFRGPRLPAVGSGGTAHGAGRLAYL